MRKSIVISSIVCLFFGSFSEARACPANQPPMAFIMGGSRTTCPNVEITFDGSPSHDSDGSIVWYQWTCTDGFSSPQLSTPFITHAFTATEDTSFVMTLTVCDDGGLTATVPCTVYVRIAPPVVWYVTKDTGDDDAYFGTSWTSAFATIEKATDVARPGDSIWVASGKYTPSRRSSPAEARSRTFMGGESVSIYGGFAGTENSVEERNALTPLTILSGDLEGNDPCLTDNSYRVCSFYRPTIIDGFTIRAGNANVTGHDTASGYLGRTNIVNCVFEDNYSVKGGALYPNSSIVYDNGGTVVDCVFRNNKAKYGGAIYTWSSPTFTRCTFQNNRATDSGGALWLDGGYVTLIDCSFKHNVSGRMGGAASVYDGGIEATNCVFYSNSAVWGGGLDVEHESTMVLTNCTIVENWCTTTDTYFGAGGTGCVGGSDATIMNCIIWGNKRGSICDSAAQMKVGSNSTSTTNYSCVQGWSVTWPGVGNIAMNPRLRDLDHGDVHLAGESPCIDAGNPAGNYDELLDYEGDPRVMGNARIDMGADEWRRPVYVDENAPGAQNGSSWADAFRDLQSALTYASAHESEVSEIWVAQGKYGPTVEAVAGDNRSVTFTLPDNITIVGGYPNGGGVRNTTEHPTILTGVFDSQLGQDGRCYHVVTVNGVIATLDSLTIEGGLAHDGNILSANSDGGGIYCTRGNLRLRGCTMANNSAGDDGAALYCDGASILDMASCLVYGNDTADTGAIYIGCIATIVNCTVADNRAGGTTGGLYGEAGSSLSTVNCILWGNTGSGSDKAGRQLGGSLCSITYSCIEDDDAHDQSVFAGSGNTDDDPLFASRGEWQWRQADGEDFISTMSIPATLHYSISSTDFINNAVSDFVDSGIVKPDLGADYMPVYGRTGAKGSTSNADNFYEWYHHPVPGEEDHPNKYSPETSVVVSAVHDLDHPGIYKSDNSPFTPQGQTEDFTVRFHVPFTYRNGQEFSFSSDDDLFVFIGPLYEAVSKDPKFRLVADLGGTRKDAFFPSKTVTLGDFPDGSKIWQLHDEADENWQMQEGRSYEMYVFYAAREGDTPRLHFETASLMREMFVGGDYHVPETSPCIDTGNNAALPSNVIYDADGKARVFDYRTSYEGITALAPVVDMGAFEYQMQVGPIAVPDVVSTPMNIAKVVDVLANDLDPNPFDELILTGTDSREHVTAEVNGSNLRAVVCIPDAGWCGTEDITYRISDGQFTSESHITLTVTCTNHPPVAVDDPAPGDPALTVCTDQAIAIAVMDNDYDPDGDDIVASGAIVEPPSGTQGSFQWQGKCIRYQAPPNWTGIETCQYKIADVHGAQSNFATVTVHVVANAPPVAVADSAQTYRGDGIRIYVTANDTDADDDDLAVERIVTLPAHGTIVPLEPGQTYVDYIADGEYLGTDTFSYVAKDTHGAVSAPATVTVEILNQRPVATDFSVSLRACDFVQIDAMLHASDPDDDVIVLSEPIISGDIHGELRLEGNKYYYDPCDTFSGTVTFKYKAVETEVPVEYRMESDEATITVEVLSCVIARDDKDIRVYRGLANVIDVLWNDDRPATISSVSTPSHGYVVVADDKDSLTYYTANLTYVGGDSFSYTIKNASGIESEPAVVTLMIENATPVIADDYAFTYRGREIEIYVLDNDYDPDGGPLELHGPNIEDPVHGTIRLAGDHFVYRPDPDFTGWIRFWYYAEDPDRDNREGEVTVLVLENPLEELNEGPAVNAGDDVTITYPGQRSVVLAGEVSDDGVPFGALMLTKCWSVETVLGGGTALFEDIYDPCTAVWFSSPGTYVLRLEADDGELFGWDVVTIQVEGTAEQPYVYAGSSTVIPLSSSPLDMSTLATVPSVSPARCATEWQVIGGNVSGVSFSDPTAIQPVLTFTSGGYYILRINAADGLFRMSDEVAMTVVQVEAGANKSATLPEGTNPTVTVAMSDAYARGWKSYQWSVTSGNATSIPNFDAQKGELNPTFEFAAAGAYELTLTATSDTVQHQDGVWVTVLDPSATEPGLVRAIYAGGARQYDLGEGVYVRRGVVYRRETVGAPWTPIVPDNDPCRGLGRVVTSVCEYNGTVYASTIGTWNPTDPDEIEQSGVWRWEGVPGTWTLVSGEDDWATESPDSVLSLVVYNGRLYAGVQTDNAGQLFRYDESSNGAWDCVIDLMFSGLECLYVWRDMLYMGDFYQDRIGCYDQAIGAWESLNVDVVATSCIWDFCPFDGSLYAGAHAGVVYESHDGITWNQYGSGFEGGTEVYALAQLGDYLYAATQADTSYHQLYRRTASSDFSAVPDIPDSSVLHHIMALLPVTNFSDEDRLLVGTGCSVLDLDGDCIGGTVYSYDPCVPSFTPISDGISSAFNVQCLAEACTKPVPENVTLTVSAMVEQGEDGYVTATPETPVTPADPAYDEIRYSITCSSTGQTDSDNMTLVAQLPTGADFVSASAQGVYSNGKVVWCLGSLGTSRTDSFELMLRINRQSMPGGKVSLHIWVSNAYYYLTVLNDDISIAYWSGDVVFVAKANPTGVRTGTSWETAFTDLHQALRHAAAADATYTQIWVAHGNYETNHTFRVPEGLALYGGFAGNENSLTRKDLSDIANGTILSGSLSANPVTESTTNTVLDGFVITGHGNGVNCRGSEPVVRYCRIQGNAYRGIECFGAVSPQIINNWISDNGEGIKLDSSCVTPVIRNNTIVGHPDCGIVSDSEITVTNCIIWGNTPDNDPYPGQAYNCTLEYCYCGTDDPFSDYLARDFHLASGVDGCIDSGFTDYVGADEVDIDGELRIVGESVDIGADEFPAVRVNAGKDISVALPSSSDSVNVPLSAEFTVAPGSTISADELDAQWEAVGDGASGVSLNGQDTLRQPKVTFNGAGTYILKVSAKHDGYVKAYDTVTVTVGMRLVATPNLLGWAGATGTTATLTASGFVSRIPARVAWYGPAGAVSLSPTESTTSPFETTVAFVGGPARYQLRAVAYDSGDQPIAEGSIWVPVAQRQVEVDLDADSRVIVLPDNTVTLSASIGGIDPTALTFTPVCAENVADLVTFASVSESSSQFSATFAAGGTYTIGVSVEDDYGYVGCGSVDIVVLEVVTSDNMEVGITDATGGVDLSGAVSNAAYQMSWESLSSGLVISGSGPTVTAQMTEWGIYYARCLVKDSDGNIVTHRDTVITVQPKPSVELAVTAADTSLYVLPGAYAETTVSCEFGGIPDYTIEWVRPAGSVCSFEYEQPSAQSTKVQFTSVGTYAVGVVIKDGSANIVICGHVSVSVEPEPLGVAVTCVSSPSGSATYHDGVSLDLQAVISPSQFTGSVEWACCEDSTMVRLSALDARKVRATFSSIGRYTIRCYAIADGLRVAYGDITVLIESPEVSLDARVQYGTEDPVREYSGILTTGAPMTFNLVGVSSGYIPAGITYEWSCWRVLGNRGTESVSVEDNTSLMGASISLTQDGQYRVELSALDGDVVIARPPARIVLYSSVPIVSIGIPENTEMDLGQVFHLSQARIWDNDTGGIDSDHIQWTCSPAGGWSFDYGDPYSRQNPALTFSIPGYYVLNLAYTDADGLTGSDSIGVWAQYGLSIEMDNHASAWTHRPLTFDRVYINTTIPDLEFRWSVTSANGAYVRFPKGRDIQRPELIFDQAGTYTLKLDVYDSSLAHLGYATVEFSVVDNPADDGEPPAITLAEINDVSFLGGGTTVDNVRDVQKIEIEAADSDIDDICLTLDGQILSLDHGLVAETANRQPGSPTSRPKLSKVFLFDPHRISTAPVSRVLTACANDRTGHTTCVSVTLNMTNVIYDYSVDSTMATAVRFSAALTSSLAWQLDAFYASDTAMTSPVRTCARTEPSASVSCTVDFTGASNGRYKARLTAGGDTAFVYFDVAATASNTVVATLDEQLRSTDEDGNRRELRRVTTGTYELLGKAYHPAYPDTEVAPGVITSSVSYRLLLSNDEGLCRNITPSELDADGYARGSIGSDAAEGLFGVLDLTSLPNGVYTISLLAQCAGSCETDEVQFVLDSPLKIGNVKFSQQDLVVPIGSYPLSIIRTYDSFKKDKSSDFGYGWEMSFSNMDISVKNDGIYRDVTLTLPSGDRVTFISQFVDRGNWASWSKTLTYQIPQGYGIKSFTTYDSGPYSEVARWDIGVGWYWQYHDDSGSPLIPGSVDVSLHEPAGWCLTMEDGTQYIISRYAERVDVTGFVYDDGWLDFEYFAVPIYSYRACGKPYLKSIRLGPVDGAAAEDTRDRVEFTVAANSLDALPVVTAADYRSWSGSGANTLKSVEILRDGGGRITAINAPSEYGEPATGTPTIRYDYDVFGNLEYVHRLADKNAADPYTTTRFEYYDGTHHERDHYVTKIMDDRGLVPIQYLYDENGRLIGTQDAKGNRILLTQGQGTAGADICDYQEVKDRSGNRARYFYNDRGGIVLEQHLMPAPADTVLSSAAYVYDGYTLTYNENEYPGETYTNPAPDKPCVVIDSAGNPSYYQYDAAGHQTAAIDQELNKTATTYDSYGSVLTTTQYRARRDNDGDPITDAGRIVFDELTTTENVYDSRSRVIFSGMRTGPSDNVTWHSMTLSYYDTSSHLTNTVQIDTSCKSDLALADVVNGNTLVDLADLPRYSEGLHAITTYVYDDISSNSPDQPSSVTDPAGATMFFHYDGNGSQDVSWYESVGSDGLSRRVTSISEFDGMGRVIATRRIIEKFESSEWTEVSNILLSASVYNSIGKVDYSIDENGNLTKYEYDGPGNLTETRTYHIGAISPDDKEAIATYIADPANVLTISQTLYDAEGRTLVSVGPYEPDVYTTQAQDKWPVGTETVYDSLGRAIETRRWPGVRIAVTKLTDPGGYDIGRTTTGWTSNDKLPVVKASIGSGEQGPLSYSRSIYDEAGRVVHSITLDSTGTEQPTSYIYDNAGKQLVVIDPLGHDLTGLYSSGIALANGTVVQKIDFAAFNPQTNFTGTHQTATHYDGQQRDYVTDARGNTTRFGYDEAGRLTWTQYPETEYVDGFGSNGTPTIATSHTYVHTGYDGTGQRAWESEQTPIASVTDPEFATVNKEEFRYDTSGRLIMVILPAVDDPEDSLPDTPVHPVYRYYHNKYGNQIGILDPKGRATIFTYDEQNRQTRAYTPYEVTFDPAVDLTDPDVYPAFDTIDDIPAGQKHVESHYDDFGRTQWQADYKGQVTGFFYDSLGRLHCKRYYETLSAYEGNPDTGWKLQYEYFHDDLGRNWKVVETDDDPLTLDRIEEYVFDAEGRVTTATTPEGAAEYSYHPITGTKASTSSPNTETLYSYDYLGRLNTVTRPGTGAVQYAYDAAGNRESITLPNQVHTRYTYDELNRLTDLRHLKTPTVTDVLSGFAHTVNARGARTVVTESIDEGHDVIYDYDNAHRLTYEENLNPDDRGCKARYVYDLVGNRVRRQVYVDNDNITDTQTLTTDYVYYDGTDKLHYEHHRDDVAFAALPWGSQNRVYACSDSGGISYQVPGMSGRVGQASAFFIGLPSVWNKYVLAAALIGLAAIILWPIGCAGWYRLRSGGWQMRHDTRIAMRSGLCILLAYIFLVGPEWFNSLAQASLEYSSLSTLAWARAGDTIEYGYDANGSLISKVTRNGSGDVTESRAYKYDLRGRLAREVDTGLAPDDPADDTPIAEFAYDSSGIRVKKIDRLASTATYYLIDEQNHTGYTQVLEERTYVIAGGTETLDAAVYYTIGDDVISQTKVTYPGGVATFADTQYLLYDGQGSTRQLLNHTPDGSGEPVVTESYDYDSYGVMLGSGANPANGAATNLLYSGEQYDSSLSQYCLRARYYDQSNGRFTTLDPYPGNTSDPQSLHKYTYCHNDPVNGLDPSGMSFYSELGVHIHSKICKMYRAEHTGVIFTNESMPGWDRVFFPDIMDFRMKEIGEIKPLSGYGVAEGAWQLTGYLAAANYLKIAGGARKSWTPLNWVVGIRAIPLPAYARNYFAVTICNASGVIFYKVFKTPTEMLKAVILATLISALAEKLARIANQLEALAKQGYGALQGGLVFLNQAADVIFSLVYAEKMGQYGLYLNRQYTIYGIMAMFTVAILLTTLCPQYQ